MWIRQLGPGRVYIYVALSNRKGVGRRNNVATVVTMEVSLRKVIVFFFLGVHLCVCVFLRGITVRKKGA